MSLLCCSAGNNVGSDCDRRSQLPVEDWIVDRRTVKPIRKSCARLAGACGQLFSTSANTTAAACKQWDQQILGSGLLTLVDLWFRLYLH